MLLLVPQAGSWQCEYEDRAVWAGGLPGMVSIWNSNRGIVQESYATLHGGVCNRPGVSNNRVEPDGAGPEFPTAGDRASDRHQSAAA
ncbi:hypothetical protein FIBSPDRAFT_853611 [Athelia psychrophila]|uniref:Uncharacterized protein n=1 Tax=Athelia psychrophila TaxID=1759441 RepID=A0A166QQ56_9AGAM|nr:hypothetical protein FIBSPDRAFT_853611 [Fibularhizoctonia sp. CBS 109695]